MVDKTDGREAPLQRVIAKSRFFVLDSWRGLCALLVAVHNLNFGPWIPQSAFVAHSSLFVDFFFVLSGFVITHAYGAKISSWPQAAVFVARRFGRLWPLHVAILACFVILHGIVGWELGEAAINPALSLRTIVTNLLFIQIYDQKSWLTWNAPSWSISAEFWTYLVFAMVCLLFSTRRQHVVALVAIAIGAGSVISLRSTNWLETNTADTVFRCLYGFAFGGLTYHAFRSLPARSGSVLEIFAVLLVIAYVDRTGNQVTSMIAPAIFGFSIWVFAQERGILSAAMKMSLFVRLGAWSYSIYMVHWLLRNFLLHADETIGKWTADRLIAGHLPMIGEPIQLMVVSLYLLATVLLAAVTYRWIEQPGRQFAKRWVAGFSRSGPA